MRWAVGTKHSPANDNRLSNSIPSTYTIYEDGRTYRAECNVASGTDYNNSNAATLIQNAFDALTEGESIFIKPGTYSLDSDVTLDDKRAVQILSNGAILSGAQLIITGTSWGNSERPVIGGLTFSGANGGAEIDNVFLAKFQKCLFLYNNVGLAVKSSVDWSEFLHLEDVLFRDCVKGLVFKTPTGSGTGSYANSRLDNVGFSNESNIGAYVHVEAEAGVSVNEGIWENTRFWHNFDSGVSINVIGSMIRTKLFYPVFESFVAAPAALNGIVLGAAADAPWVLGVLWEGTWTNKYHNPNTRYLQGLGEIFAQNVVLTVGINSVYGATSSFTKTYGFALISLPIIYVLLGGAFAGGENITVRIRAVYVDGQTATTTIVYPDTDGVGAKFLTDQQYLWLTITNNFIEHLEAEAFTDDGSTTVTVTVFAGATAC